ncbi:hypothetical protein, partial [Pseudothauera lacus]|uniref:hypothetical protein n=1 Tax=Pseudothauera lacus TaxID=2136175 RepID=UPI001C636133
NHCESTARRQLAVTTTKHPHLSVVQVFKDLLLKQRRSEILKQHNHFVNPPSANSQTAKPLKVPPFAAPSPFPDLPENTARR